MNENQQTVLNYLEKGKGNALVVNYDNEQFYVGHSVDNYNFKVGFLEVNKVTIHDGDEEAFFFSFTLDNIEDVKEVNSLLVVSYKNGAYLELHAL